MAPELFQKKTYGKVTRIFENLKSIQPVDTWSCGIIMYMLFSGGNHPLYKPQDTEETYWAKLKDPAWVFPPSFNRQDSIINFKTTMLRYSKDLFFKLVCPDPIGRYTAEHALNHPWITRRFEDDIPLTSPEKMRAFSHSQILSRVINIGLLLKLCQIIKTMYIIYKLPGTQLEIDPQHKERV